MGIIDRISKKATKPADEAKVVAPKKARATKKAAPKAETEVVATTTVAAKTAHTILLRPVVTEKASLAQSVNKYTFIVPASAKKNQIKVAIKELYNVDPIAVNVVNVEGHRVRFGKNLGRKADMKKAIVTLPKGKTITIHEGV